MTGPSRARQYLTGQRSLWRLGTAARSAARSRDGTSHGLLADLAATWRLLRAWLRGDYRGLRLRSILAVVAGLVYFLSPIDLIPDWFLLLGLTDDLVVVSLVFGVLRQELTGFRAWEAARSQLGISVLRTVRDG